MLFWIVLRTHRLRTRARRDDPETAAAASVRVSTLQIGQTLTFCIGYTQSLFSGSRLHSAARLCYRLRPGKHLACQRGPALTRTYGRPSMVCLTGIYGFAALLPSGAQPERPYLTPRDATKFISAYLASVDRRSRKLYHAYRAPPQKPTSPVLIEHATHGLSRIYPAPFRKAFVLDSCGVQIS